MSEETNKTNYTENERTMQNGIENAFSDLISEYFQESNNNHTTSNIQAGPVLDWDSVSNGQLYTNLTQNLVNEQTNEYGDDSSYWDTPICDSTVVGTDYGTQYNEAETQDVNDVNSETIAQNVYGVITVNGNLLNGINSEGIIENAENKKNAVNIVNVVNNSNTVQKENLGTEFKLTQANLPAKIGFWTKVRNFFIADSKISYSVEQAENQNVGLWNKVQNFFSFGKNK